MKKLVAISFLLLFLFNTAGYYFVQNYLMNKASVATTNNIDRNNYDYDQLIELKVPLNMPYYQNTNFERHEGTITIKGILYSYVERKIENGFLIIKCLPDWKSQQVKENTGDYFAKANGIDKSGAGKQDHSKIKVKISIDDFEEHLFQTYPEMAQPTITLWGSAAHSFTPSQHTNCCEQPPELNA